MHSDASCCLEITFWWWIFALRLEQPVGLDVFTAAIAVHISICYKSHIDEFPTVLLHPGDSKEVKQLVYATLHSLAMGQLGPNMQELTYYAIIVILTNCVHFSLHSVVES